MENFTIDEIRIRDILISIGQEHIFEDWDPPGINDDLKQQMLQQLIELNKGYPIEKYISNAKILLANAKNEVNPLMDWVPEVGAAPFVYEPLSEEFMSVENLGLSSVGECAFVLVAGGLGERLGYNGIKVALPIETVTFESYLSHYCHQILAIQERFAIAKGNEEPKIPFVIMVSDDTIDKTLEELEIHSYFGLEKSQVTLLKQGKVPAIEDNSGRISKSSKYVIDSKPHGHGDVHSLLYESGLPQQWVTQNIQWCLFFQDTNALGALALPLMIGNSIRNKLDMNSMAVGRRAKQAVGALINLKHKESNERMTINVEYNQLDSLLRANGFTSGDLNDKTSGYSPFPGNINMLLMKLSSYVDVLNHCEGRVDEFVNPKYADKAKERFKKPTRLECMMQDIGKSFCKAGFTAGYTLAPAWFCYNPCKNNVKDAVDMAASGVPGASPLTAESMQYTAYAELLRRYSRLSTNGEHCMVEEGEDSEFLGLTGVLSPRIIIHPSCALFVSELVKCFPFPKQVHISKRSTLVMSCEDMNRSKVSRLNGCSSANNPGIVVENLSLDGSVTLLSLHRNLILKSREQLSALNVSGDGRIIDRDGQLCIENAGHILLPSSGESIDSAHECARLLEVIKMRGYVIKPIETIMISIV